MCGILGIVSNKDVIYPMVEGLKKLAYRGYDSSGIATLKDGNIIKRKAQGKIKNLEKLLAKDPIEGNIGIAHTRWATHGIPNKNNAHPHTTKDVAIVHNGIIENYKQLISRLKVKPELSSETDSEIIAHLFTELLSSGKTLKQAVISLMYELKGAFAIGILIANQNKLIAIRRGSPLAVGYGNNQNFIGSDAVGLAPFTKKISYLEDEDWAIIDCNNLTIYNKHKQVDRVVNTISISSESIEKSGYKHYMHKEIHEQPVVIAETLKSFIDPQKKMFNYKSKILENNFNKITLVACGTSSFACRIARHWFEKYSDIPVEVDIASEYRYRKIFSSENQLVIFISQSGETRDTIASLEEAKKNKLKTLSVVNVSESTISRMSDEHILTLAGPEIGVASTKAFLTQLLTLLILSILIGKNKKLISIESEKKIVEDLIDLPTFLLKILEKENYLRNIASDIYSAKDILYIGRGVCHGIALEGALKLKEISYIHAEGYAAGELKHGPIALIDESVPVIGIVPTNNLFDKTLSNLSEVNARGGKIITITDESGKSSTLSISNNIFTISDSSEYCQPILCALPVQLLAYHIAVLKGTDVDQPRNLAKSVTVE